MPLQWNKDDKAPSRLQIQWVKDDAVQKWVPLKWRKHDAMLLAALHARTFVGLHVPLNG